MINITPAMPRNHNFTKYDTLQDKLAAIRTKNFSSRRNNEGFRELVWYPDSGSSLCWINEETENYTPHWHTAIEIIMPLENLYTVRLDKQECVLQEGDILIIPPGTLHELIAPASGYRVILLVNYTTLSRFPGFSMLSSLLTNPILIGPGKAGSNDAYEFSRDMLLSIVDIYANDEPYWSLHINALFLQLLIELNYWHTYSNKMLPQFSSGKQKEYIQKFNAVFDYIDHNYMEDLSLETVADAAGFSKFHFSRLFKQFTNMSFNEYLNTRRIQEAVALLSSQEMTITEVALMSGFPSISTFNRVFRNLKHCTPTEFRKYQT